MIDCAKAYFYYFSIIEAMLRRGKVNYSSETLKKFDDFMRKRTEKKSILQVCFSSYSPPASLSIANFFALKNYLHLLKLGE
jgi:hypothetical protein